jgi:long-chain acyl-CoA synthetase
MTMEKFWMKSWPDYLSTELSYRRDKKPVFEYLRDNAQEFPDRVAIIFYGAETTYRELDEKSEQFAHFLMDTGFKKGDRIALFLPSCPQYHIAHYGISKMGGIIVPCSPVFKEWELTYELKDSGAQAIVALDLLFPVAQASCAEAGIEKMIITSFHDVLPAEPTIDILPFMGMPKTTYPDTVELNDILSKYPSAPVTVNVGLDDTVQLQYTGGTTGLPKGAILTHGAKLFKVAAISTLLRDSIKHLGFEEEVLTCLCILPTFHIAGMLGSVDSMIAYGATQVLLVMFEPVAAMQAIDKYRVQFFSATVPMNTGIMEHPERKQYDLSSLAMTLTTSFGIQLTDEIVEKWRVATNGGLLSEASYGLTETHTFDTFMPIDNPKCGTQGIPNFETEIKIVSFDNPDQEMPVGEMGEIVVRNPSAFKGYWNRPEETAKALRDGWVYTGDMGRFDDDGYLTFLGRKKEMIKTSGFSVFPEEVEEYLARHPAVEMVAAIGIPDSQKGEVVKAFVVPGSEYKEKITADELIEWARKKISSYKVPKAIEFRDELPISGVGKTLRRILVEEEKNKRA